MKLINVVIDIQEKIRIHVEPDELNETKSLIARRKFLSIRCKPNKELDSYEIFTYVSVTSRAQTNRSHNLIFHNDHLHERLHTGVGNEILFVLTAGSRFPP